MRSGGPVGMSGGNCHDCTDGHEKTLPAWVTLFSGLGILGILCKYRKNIEHKYTCMCLFSLFLDVM